MTLRHALAAAVIASLTIAGCLMAPDLARAQDDDDFFEDFLAEIKKDKEDQKRCRGNPDVSASEQEAACSRLIEGAPKENDLVGEYYVDRAMARETRAAQCQDVRKGIEIIERSKSTIYGKKFLDAARSLEEAACE